MCRIDSSDKDKIPFELQPYIDPTLGQLVVYFEYNDFDSEMYAIGYFEQVHSIEQVVACGYEVHPEDIQELIKRLYNTIERIQQLLGGWKRPQ